MLNNLKRFFNPPVFEDEDKTYKARVLNIILLALMPVVALATANMLFVLNDLDLFITTITAFGSLLLAWVLLRFKYLTLASLLVSVPPLGVFTLNAYNTNGIHSIELMGFAFVIALAGLVLGGRWPLFFTVASFLCLGWLTYAEVNGIIITPFSGQTSYAEWLNIGVVLFMMGVVLQVTIGNLSGNLRRVRLNEQALNQSNRQLQAIQESLEAQVEARTAGLAVVTVLGERLNALLDLEAISSELVSRVKADLGYAKAQVYLLDQATQTLIPQVRTTDQTGSILLREGEALMARAARNWQVLMSAERPDVTRGVEIAAPIMLEGQVLGVLYGQTGLETEADEGIINIWRSLANQAAVAINNARRFAETERSLAEARALQEQYIQRAWQTRAEREQEHIYQRRGEPELPPSLRAQLKQLARQQQQAIPVNPEKGADYTAVVAPIKLQNQVIGTMEFYELNPTRQWSEPELALVQVIADQVAQTAENLRLFDETRERAAREATIREITDKLRAAPTLDRLLETAARELGQQLGVRHTVLEMGIEVEPNKQG